MLHRKFAVIKLWPELKTAEDECIARLKNTAHFLGFDCLEVDSFARLIHPPHTQLTRDDVDFVISLHFETPKRYDIFSFVALWNPLQFYHDWGYRKCTRNLLTHDDFLSCSSPWADDQVKRCIANDPARDNPSLHLYHSLSDPILPPSIGDGKLFYLGINWERITDNKGRHDNLLKLLDETGELRIYGPRVFQGVNVWDGYKSYMGPLPFDGVSVIRLIHKAGICLCLSSKAHQESELMSSRLFEALAAGAIIICDANHFATKFFGDTLLYIDTQLSAQEVAAQIEAHVSWIKSESECAVELARRAQQIFRNNFTLDRCIENIYRELPGRKERLASLYRPKDPCKIAVYCLMPEFSHEVLERHIASCLCQKDIDIQPFLLLDRRDEEIFGRRIRSRLSELEITFRVEPVECIERFPDGSVRHLRPIGEIISHLIRRADEEDYLCIVSPSEQLFSDHLCSLLAAVQRSGDAGVGIAEILLHHRAEGKDHADLAEDVNPSKPEIVPGFGRFLFRRSAIRPGIETALPYLDTLPMHLLVGTAKAAVSGRCTIMVDIQDAFTVHRLTNSRINQEREILIDFAPEVFAPRSGGNADADHLKPVSLSLKEMDAKNKTALAVELAHSIPLPALAGKIGFGLYRLWLRFRQKRSADRM
jgi:hypothetical protein